MAKTPNMNLTAWDQGTDTFNYSQLADNFKAIDNHTHVPGLNGGKQIPTDGIEDLAINHAKLATDAVEAVNIKNGTISASKLALGVHPSVVSTLPSYSGSAYDGYEVYYQPTSGIIWHMVYNHAATQWQFLGGSPIIKYGATSSATLSATSYGVLGSSGSDTDCKITLAAAGSYAINFGCMAHPAAGGLTIQFTTAIGVNGTSTTTGDIRIDLANGIDLNNTTASYTDFSGRQQVTNTVTTTITAGQYVQPVYKKATTTGTGNAAVWNRYISVTPITLTS